MGSRGSDAAGDALLSVSNGGDAPGESPSRSARARS